MKYIYTCSLLLLLSCSSSHPPIDLADETVIVPELFSDELVIPPPMQIEYLDPYLIFMTPNTSSSLLFMNEKTEETFTWGRTGNGPDDFSSVSCVGKEGNKMKLYDTNLRKYAEYEVLSHDSILLNRIESRQVNSGSISLLRIHVMSNGMIVGFAGLGSKKMFVLMDENFKIIKSFGDSPINNLPEENFILFHGCFTSYKNKLFFASQPTGYMICFDIDSQGNIVKDWDMFLEKPIYDADSWRWAKENKWGFYDIQATEDYLFAAYSGKSLLDESQLPQNILVFTHEGKLIKNVKYENESFGRFTISNSQKIYTFGNDRLMVSDLDRWGL